MTGPGDIAGKIRHRKFTWCRRHNGFSDQPLWRLVARETGLPLAQVVAFVNRLEEFANAAIPRGYVGDFNAAEFGAALDMSTEEAARIFAALERHEIGWVLQDHLANFWERNPDKEDRTAGERKERWRARRKQLRADALSTGTGGNAVPDRDIVPVTPRAEHTFRGATVDNSGEIARRAAAGSAMSRAEPGPALPPTPKEWLKSEGVRIVTERMCVMPGVAETKIERWLREVAGNREALALMIDAARQLGVTGDAFEESVADQIRQRRLDALGPRLRLTQSFKGGAA